MFDGLRPPVSFHFRVDVLGLGDGDADARFQEVTGLSREVSVEELAEGGENRFVHKLPGRARYGNLVLKRGLAKGSKLHAWCESAIGSLDIQPKTVTVSLLNEEHQPLVSWSFERAWPVKYSVSDLKAQDNALSIETLELAYSRFSQVEG
jgi:phage tail-like protein